MQKIMPGETNLSTLLRTMKPELHEGEFVYCLAPSLNEVIALEPICMFQEAEGVTVILPKGKADSAALPYPVVCAWITLTVHSSLEAVGLTAAVSKALTEVGISCNVVAAFYHDHIFVPIQDAERAMQALLTLCKG